MGREGVVGGFGLRSTGGPERGDGLLGDAHSRFQLHFVPTGSSWLNMVEGVFGDLTKRRLRRGSFNSVPALIAAIQEYLAARNQDPKPFVWIASVANILAKLRDCMVISETIH